MANNSVANSLVLHDYFATAEGGGRLSTLLATGLDADVGYGFRRPEHPFVQGAKHNPKEHDYGLYLPVPLLQQWRLARAFEYQSTWLQGYEQIIYSGFYTPLAVNQAQGYNLLYCHTPPRFIYDQYDFYRQQIPAVLRPVLQAFVNYLKPRYEAAVAQMDAVVCNSENVQARIRQHLGIEATVVYPPCDTEHLRFQGQGDYYLSTARLDPLKRVDKIIAAFLQMPEKKLVVASGGSELPKLKQMAAGANNIHFSGWLSDRELQEHIGKAIATLYLPSDEDFGMSPVESMAAGKPVIGVAEGGLLESIIDGQTGLLLKPDFGVEEIITAVNSLTPKQALDWRAACEQRASRFSIQRFLAQMQQQLPNS